MLPGCPPLQRRRVVFFHDAATPEIYTLSLHAALPISVAVFAEQFLDALVLLVDHLPLPADQRAADGGEEVVRVDVDRKSTRLNSSHANISYAVFCLKKKNTSPAQTTLRHAPPIAIARS